MGVGEDSTARQTVGPSTTTLVSQMLRELELLILWYHMVSATLTYMLRYA